jgi:D-alanyl-D-alanine dipeptidase
LVTTAEHLPDGLCLVIWDGWRSREVQARLFSAYRARVVAENPFLDAVEIDRLASVFISLPSSDPTAPAPHNTGGSVDLTLADASGACLPMGTDFDDFSPLANTDYFQRLAAQKALTPEEQVILENRGLLGAVMAASGFSNYPAEWWHFDYGNQWAASRGKNRAAVYGPALY